MRHYGSLRKNASAGIDGVTYAEYETNAEGNIRQLHRRLVAGKYQAQPLRRVYIPKENGKQRPISIPSLEDKIVQKVVVDSDECHLRAGFSRLLVRV